MTITWLTRREASQYLKVNPRTLDRWVTDGRLTRYHVEGLRSVRFKVSELDALMKPEPSVAA